MELSKMNMLMQLNTTTKAILEIMQRQKRKFFRYRRR
jgi:hypothetical protein